MNLLAGFSRPPRTPHPPTPANGPELPDEQPAESPADSLRIHARHAGHARGARLTVDGAIAAACTIAVLVSAWWALAAPLRGLPAGAAADAGQGPGSATAASRAGETPEPNAAEPLDLAAFRAPLWVAPPSPTTPATAAPPPPPSAAAAPPPLKWQLLGITCAAGDSRAARAMLYDPDSDSVLELAAGQEHSGKVIDRIDGGTVTIRQGEHTYTLSLEHPAAAAARSPGGGP